MILVIDNYAAFTYNLCQYAGEVHGNVEVYRNDSLTVEEVAAKKPVSIIISSGSGYPVSAGISVEVVRRLGARVPILGICLGHQVIAEAYGGRVARADKLVHGKVTGIDLLTECALFEGLPSRIDGGNYYSLAIERHTLPDVLQITATAADGVIMGLKHKEYNVFGVQFHPESILTPCGKKILENFINLSRRYRRQGNAEQRKEQKAGKRGRVDQK
jgi:anthranilate synthase/aminodeoxychorismate synthase-like glutamine amidotransferase